MPVTVESREADVYMVEKDDLSGPWEVTNVLAAPQQYENDRGEAQLGEFQAHTLQILVADVPGVLQQVKSLARAVWFAKFVLLLLVYVLLSVLFCVLFCVTVL